ncbi:MAG: response regulator [Candidatus Latescibacterota bacterium]|nr:MAG: response regulator [Candidatus Latescibacterota bacterium]
MARILIVDDDPDILETLQHALGQEGYAVDVESNGNAALASARTQPPDLAVLDVMLPGLNGYEVARRLKQEMRDGVLPPFPVLMLTARRVRSAARLDFVSAWSRADATLWKPYDLGVLLFRVRTLLDAARVESAEERP